MSVWTLDGQQPTEITVGFLLWPVTGSPCYQARMVYPDNRTCELHNLSREAARQLQESLLADGYVGTGLWDQRMVYTRAVT